MSLMELVTELLKLGGVGLISGIFSSWLASKNYRYRKWWELRVAAYQSAIEALSDIIDCYNRHWNAAIERRQLSKEVEQEIKDFGNQSFLKVRRLADTGAFLFSDRANNAFREFMSNGSESDYYEYLDNELKKSKKCLTELVACSKEDLRIKERFIDKWLT